MEDLSKIPENLERSYHKPNVLQDQVIKVQVSFKHSYQDSYQYSYDDSDMISKLQGRGIAQVSLSLSQPSSFGEYISLLSFNLIRTESVFYFTV